MPRAVETLWDEEEDLSPVDVGKVVGTAVASLGASQSVLLAKLEESQSKLISGLSDSNAALVKAFAQALSGAAPATKAPVLAAKPPVPPAKWEFTVERDKTGLMTKVSASTPAAKAPARWNFAFERDKTGLLTKVVAMPVV